MEATSDAEATEGHLRKLPTDLRKQVEEVNALVDLPVEGYYIWLKYVVSNIFRVAELNKVLSLLMSRTKARKSREVDEILQRGGASWRTRRMEG